MTLGITILLSGCSDSTDEEENSAPDTGVEYTNYDPDYQYADLDTGIKIAYVELGDASDPSVVFLHGATDTYLSWAQIAPRIADAGYHVIVPELRGHGKTDKPEEGPYTISSHAADIDALLTELEIEDAHFVGHSLGTFISQDIAVEYPDKVASLTLIGSALTVDGNETLAWLLEGDGESFHGIDNETELSDEFLEEWTTSSNYDPAFVTKTFDNAKELPLYVWRNIFHGLTSAVDGISNITVPVQLIWGSEDGFFSQEDQDALIEALSGTEAKLIVKEGLGHNTHWEAHEDEDIAKDILKFIK
jgi:pimeloyl-ACP methyl ester carboxylesterase